MANLQHDQVPPSTLAPQSASGSGRQPGSSPSGSPHTAALAVLSARFLDSAVPASAFPLVTDLIQASGGSPQGSDAQTLSASFPSLPLAVLIARRLQWALQGLAGPGVAIVLQSAAEAAQAAAPTPLPAGGQILLSPDVTASVLDLPGLELRTLPAGQGAAQWTELLWRDPAAAVSYGDDEKALLRLIRDCGREDPCLPAAAPHPTNATPPATIGAGTPSPLPPPSRIASGPTLGIAARLAQLTPPMRRWLLFGAAMAAVLLLVLVILIVVGGHRTAAPAQASSPQAPSASQPAAQPGTAPSVPSARAGAPANLPPSPAASGPANVPSRPPAKKAAAADTHSEPRSRKTEDIGACDFTDAGVTRALARAETDMHDGRLEQAKAAFLKLRGCSSARERAEEDLRTVQRKIDAQAR